MCCNEADRTHVLLISCVSMTLTVLSSQSSKTMINSHVSGPAFFHQRIDVWHDNIANVMQHHNNGVLNRSNQRVAPNVCVPNWR